MGEMVVVIGDGGRVASRVVDGLRAAADIDRVVDGSDKDDRAVIAGADAVVLLGAATRPGDAVTVDGTANQADVTLVREVLAAVAAAPTPPRLVVLSSAMVYGAWANNPVPLTEDATLRPDPGVRQAVARAEIERLVVDARADGAALSIAVLRPTITVAPAAEDPGGWLDRSPWVPPPWRAGDAGHPTQFLSEADLASAVVHAVHERLDGPFNVAPEGWISGETLPELTRPTPRVQVPPPIAELLLTFRLRRAGFPPAISSYLHHPWVVASDRLRATGWTPADTNEEAFVAAFEGGPFATMDARRRQSLSLGVAAAAVVVTAVALVRRHRRRTR